MLRIAREQETGRADDAGESEGFWPGLRISNAGHSAYYSVSFSDGEPRTEGSPVATMTLATGC